MKKLITLLSLLCLAATTLSACAAQPGGAQSESASTPTATSTASETTAVPPVTLTMALMCNDFYDTAQEMAAAFESQNPNVTVELSQIPNAINEYLQPKAAANLLPDFMSVNADSFALSLYEEGLLADINDYPDIKSRIIPQLVDPFIAPDGGYFGVSGGLSSVTIYYNKELFSQAGLSDADIPQDWPQFLAVCESIQSANITPLIVATADSTANNTFWTIGMATNFSAKGKDYAAAVKDGSFDFTQPGYVDVYAKAKTLMDGGYLVKGVTSLKAPGAMDTFLQGEGAMLFAGIWLAGPVFNGAEFEVGVMAAPWNEPGEKKGCFLGSETGYAIAKNANEEWSAKFLDFVVNGDGFYIYQNGRGNQPYILDYDESRIKMHPDMAAYVKMITTDTDFASGQPPYQVLQSKMLTQIPTTVQQVLNGESTPEQAAEIFNDLYNEK